MRAIQEKSLNQSITALPIKESEEIVRANARLTETIARVEDKNRDLENRLAIAKLYQRAFKHSISMQCKFCRVFHPAEVFIDHVKSCTKEANDMRTHFFQLPLSLLIVQVRMTEDPYDHRTYTEYSVQVKFNGQCWHVNHKYRDFYTLHESLINCYPSVQFPRSS